MDDPSGASGAPSSDQQAVGQVVGEDSLDRSVEKDSGLQKQFRPFYPLRGKATGNIPQEKVSGDEAIPETAMETS